MKNWRFFPMSWVFFSGNLFSFFINLQLHAIYQWFCQTKLANVFIPRIDWLIWIWCLVYLDIRANLYYSLQWSQFGLIARKGAVLPTAHSYSVTSTAKIISRPFSYNFIRSLLSTIATNLGHFSAYDVENIWQFAVTLSRLFDLYKVQNCSVCFGVLAY